MAVSVRLLYVSGMQYDILLYGFTVSSGKSTL